TSCSPILRAMETRHSPRPALAALLSALLPGLGQFYNRQWAKGVGFMVGLLVLCGALASSADLEKLQQSAASGAQPENIGLLFLLSLLVLAVAVWSVVDAARSSRRSQQ
ncbi:MAG TPA: DUF5683 domain-containing protein, partial [Nitrospiraceae bacterium]|nr:DUF5683 domain-containing protein [Nitrospiraceae bacterium]